MFRFPLDTQELLTARAHELRAWGIASRVVERVQPRIRDAWHEGPGGWAFEWMREAEAAEERGRSLEAALLYGAAKLPCLATPLHREAYGRQIESYVHASSRFPCRFERLRLTVPYRNSRVELAIHAFAPRRGARNAPLVCLTGGVGTWKVELHRAALLLARGGRCRVAAMDMPGTGETPPPLAPDADVLYRAVIEHLREGQPAGVLGIGFGGHWAAKLALQRVVDASVDLGGPIGEGVAGEGGLLRLPNGAAGALGHALGLQHFPGPRELEDLLQPFSLRRQGLLEGPAAPLLAVNGTQDAYVPPLDTTALAGIGATVWLIEGAGHCAAERLRPTLAACAAWLRARLDGGSATTRAAERLSRAVLRPRPVVQARD